MNGINEIGRKSPSIANKIVSIGGKIKLSISNLSIKVMNTINEFIHPNRYENKNIYNTKSTFLKPKILIISNEEQNNIDNEMIESNIINSKSESLKNKKLIVSDEEKNNVDYGMKGTGILKFESEFLKPEIKKETPEYNIADEEKNNVDYGMKGTSILKFESEFLKPEIKKETSEYNIADEKKILFKKRQSVLEFIELPNKDLIPIDEAINALHSCKQDSLFKSKILLIDYITDMKFKPLMNNNVELLEKSNSNYLKESEFDDARYESVNFHSHEISEHDEKESSTLSNLNNDDTLILSNDNKVEFHSNENKLDIEKDKFKSSLIETTKDISLLDRLSDGDNSYGYTFLAKFSNFLEDYNGIKNKEKSNYFNKENYLNKLVKSDYLFKLNKKVNDIIYLQYLKNEQSKHENGVVEEIIKQPSEEEKLKETEEQKEILAGKDKVNERNLALIEKVHKARFNLINNNKLIGGFLDEIDEQLKISNENKHLTLKELLEKVKKS
ncbi:hypothetical protein ACNART_05055 [Proteus sp. LHD240705]|uniref:hypothetical protein n=1 Tax=Proteus sp. LHD240705 TaxID=3400183 RepID=UPI003A4D5ED8